ncbi:MAG: chromosomal replication initiator protein DnaA [Limnochordia bacterium]|jgi:chromosomal replication initiator protein|nr:chromosomal replication initiator protein DnaA [Bacillota bacterium]
MIEQLDLIWEKTLSLLRQDLPKPSFDTWLKGTRACSFSDGRLTVEVPNDFARDWVEARYKEDLQSALQQVVGDAWEIVLVVPKAEGAPPSAPKAAPEAAPAALNPKYTFDTFVVGNGNRFAHAASLAVAEAPARAYNPLFLYGGVGLGKTHLMQAIGHYAHTHHPHLRVVYVSSETFTNDLISAIARKSMQEFRGKYRNADILLIDDIQFVAGKESTQEEFFHTFNSLYEASKQIVITSDRSPKDIPTLEERLRSRFEWGLTADIQPPDVETRIAILKQKAQADEIAIDDETLSYIASKVESNIRELEGALNRVTAFASLHGQAITLDLAQDALKDILPSHEKRPPTIARIQEVVAEYYGATTADLQSKKRTKAVVFPRQVAMYLCRELTDSSLPQIGDHFGGRDHSTVIHACDKIANDLTQDPSLAAEVQELIRILSSP